MDDLDVWKERIRSVPDDELLAVRDADYLGLVSLKSEEWEAVVHAVDYEIQRRGLNVMTNPVA